MQHFMNLKCYFLPLLAQGWFSLHQNPLQSRQLRKILKSYSSWKNVNTEDHKFSSNFASPCVRKPLGNSPHIYPLQWIVLSI